MALFAESQYLCNAIYYIGVVLLQALLRSLTAQESSYATVASTVMVAALFMPLRRRIQALIDRHFHRSKYDPQKTLEDFASRMRDELDLENLSNGLVAVVSETMKPEHVSLWIRPPSQK